MKAILTVQHPDDVSGYTIMDDGTKAFWTEGRGSYVRVIYPDGSTDEMHNADDHHGVIRVLDGDDYGTCRTMTPGEVAEYDLTK